VFLRCCWGETRARVLFDELKLVDAQLVQRRRFEMEVTDRKYLVLRHNSYAFHVTKETFSDRPAATVFHLLPIHGKIPIPSIKHLSNHLMVE